MKKYLIRKTTESLALAGLFLMANAGKAMIWSVEIDPAVPTDADTITVTITGGFNDGCWGVGEYSFIPAGAHTFLANIQGLDTWQEGWSCPDVVIDYQFISTLAPLDSGNYVIQVTEEHESLRDPLPDNFTLTFVVRDSIVEHAHLTITPMELQFDSTEVNHSDFADVRLTNTGSATLTVTNLIVQGEAFNYPPEWVVIDLDPGEFFDVSLQFQPLAPGDVEGYAIFISSAQSSPDTVVLRGRGYIIDDATATPIAHEFGLNSLYPNPFNGEIGIEYSLARDSRARLVVYDVLGREVAELLDEDVSAGVHHLNWSCSDCAAGVYLFELVAGEMREVKKAVYLK